MGLEVTREQCTPEKFNELQPKMATITGADNMTYGPWFMPRYEKAFRFAKGDVDVDAEEPEVELEPDDVAIAGVGPAKPILGNKATQVKMREKGKAKIGGSKPAAGGAPGEVVQVL